MLISSRILVVSACGWVRRAASAAAADLCCEVATAADGPECLAKLRALTPDLVVLVPPVPWDSAADAVAALAADQTGPRVPVLVLPRPAAGENPLAVPVLVAARRAARPATLQPLVDRVCRWSSRQPAAA